MKVGDLVECINDNFPLRREGISYPKMKLIYTVRSVEVRGGEQGLLLEEIINPEEQSLTLGKREVCFKIKRFKKLDIEESMSEKIKELFEVEIEA